MESLSRERDNLETQLANLNREFQTQHEQLQLSQQVRECVCVLVYVRVRRVTGMLQSHRHVTLANRFM